MATMAYVRRPGWSSTTAHADLVNFSPNPSWHGRGEWRQEHDGLKRKKSTRRNYEGMQAGKYIIAGEVICFA